MIKSKWEPRIIEIVGLAGAGKSTLTNTLCGNGSGVVQGEDFYTPNLRDWLKYAGYCSKQILPLVPMLVRLSTACRDLTREDLKKIIYLNGWDQILKRQQAESPHIIALDQGFVFCLATLYGFGPDELKKDRFRSWWDRMFSHWAQRLDGIVWLDGPDDFLLERVATRASFHAIKDMGIAQSRQFLTVYRSAYAHVIKAIVSCSDVEIVEFDTSRESTESIASEITGRWSPVVSGSRGEANIEGS